MLNPERQSDEDNLPSKIGHIFFLSSMPLLNNTYIFIEPITRFAGFVSLISIGTALIFFFGKKRRESYGIFNFLLIFFLIISIFRINIVNSLEGNSGQIQIIQAFITTYTLICSLFISGRINLFFSRNVILVAFIILFIPIFIYRDLIFDYGLKDQFKIGVLSYDSYQMVSQITGIMVISIISLIFGSKKLSSIHYPLILLAVAGLYTITLSPARGEAIALFLAIATYFISGGRWLAIFVAIIGFVLFGNTILDSVLFSRLNEVISGNFSERDYLFGLALKQIFSDYKTFLYGGGINYYQFVNILPLELYPHNFLLESFVSGGIILFLLMAFVFLYPLLASSIRLSNDDEQKYLMCIMIFLFIIYSKSGSLISLWGLTSYACFFVASVARPINIEKLNDID